MERGVAPSAAASAPNTGPRVDPKPVRRRTFSPVNWSGSAFSLLFKAKSHNKKGNIRAVQRGLEQETAKMNREDGTKKKRSRTRLKMS